MRIVTYGDWKGNLWLDGHLMENPNGDYNYTYNTTEDEDEVICVLHLHQGKTNMIVDVNDGQADRGEAIYKVLENEDATEGKTDRRKKAMISILQVLAENELTAGEIDFVLQDVNGAVHARPLTRDFVEQFSKNADKFFKAF